MPSNSVSRFSISLRFLLVGLLAIAVFFSFASRVVREQRAHENLLSLGFSQAYDTESVYRSSELWFCWGGGPAATEKPAGKQYDGPQVQDIFYKIGLTCWSNHISFLSGARNWRDKEKYPGFVDADIASVGELRWLEIINLSYNSITDDGLAVLANLKRVHSLDLSSNQISDAGLIHLAKMKPLKILRLSGNQITDNGLKNLANLTNLEELDLSKNEISEAGLMFLKDLTQLKGLGLSSTAATGEFLKKSKFASCLEWIDLSNSKVSAQSLSYLSALTNLGYLTLDGCDISDQALAQVMPSLTKLESLSVKNTEIADAAIASIKDHKIKWLEIDNTLVTDKSFPVLLKLPLTYFSDYESSMSPENNYKIRERMDLREREQFQ